MIEPKNNIVIKGFFKYYTIWKIRRHFADIKIDLEYNDQKLPLLVIANHFSWWDGFWINYLNTKYFKRNLYFMMLEDQLKKYWFFQYTGGYSVKKNSRSLDQSLNYTAQLLENPRNLVFMFPQGEIQSSFIDKPVFEKGLQIILNRCKNPVDLVFVANKTEYFSNQKPTWYSKVRQYKGELIFANIQKDYQVFYNQFIKQHINN